MNNTQIKIFTLRFSESMEGFDDENIRLFIMGKNIIRMDGHFFLKDNVPYWTIMIVYNQMEPKNGRPQAVKNVETKKSDYKSILTDSTMPFFNLLREWRRERANKDGEKF